MSLYIKHLPPPYRGRNKTIFYMRHRLAYKFANILLFLHKTVKTSGIFRISCIKTYLCVGLLFRGPANILYLCKCLHNVKYVALILCKDLQLYCHRNGNLPSSVAHSNLKLYIMCFHNIFAEHSIILSNVLWKQISKF